MTYNTKTPRELALKEFPANENDLHSQREIYVWFQIHENTIRAALSQEQPEPIEPLPEEECKRIANIEIYKHEDGSYGYSRSGMLPYADILKCLTHHIGPPAKERVNACVLPPESGANVSTSAETLEWLDRTYFNYGVPKPVYDELKAALSRGKD